MSSLLLHSPAPSPEAIPEHPHPWDSPSKGPGATRVARMWPSWQHKQLQPRRSEMLLFLPSPGRRALLAPVSPAVTGGGIVCATRTPLSSSLGTPGDPAGHLQQLLSAMAGGEAKPARNAVPVAAGTMQKQMVRPEPGHSPQLPRRRVQDCLPPLPPQCQRGPRGGSPVG